MFRTVEGGWKGIDLFWAFERSVIREMQALQGPHATLSTWRLWWGTTRNWSHFSVPMPRLSNKIICDNTATELHNHHHLCSIESRHPTEQTLAWITLTPFLVGSDTSATDGRLAPASNIDSPPPAMSR